MASSVFGCSIFGAIGLSSHGSMAIAAPPGVVITQAACPHHVAVVADGAAGAAGAGCLPGTTGGAIPGLSAMCGSAATAGAGAGAGAACAAGAFLSLTS